MFYRMRLFKGIFLHSDFFLTELNFLKGDTIFILNKELHLKKRKDFYWEGQSFAKIILIFFLKI